jgi:hypothetical protein
VSTRATIIQNTKNDINIIKKLAHFVFPVFRLSLFLSTAQHINR